MEKLKHKDSIIVIAAGFMALFFIFDKKHEWMLYVSLGILIIGFVSPLLTRYIHIAWFWIAEKLGFVVSRIILGITFLVILMPVAALSKLFRKDFMMLKKREKSYYHERDHLFSADDMKDPW